MSSYLRISDYGMIGDLKTVALVGRNGAIDWCCMPHFDSPSIFASLLDASKGGSFRIDVSETEMTSHAYVEDTAILETRYSGSLGVVVVTDFMPIAASGPSISQHTEIHRIVRCESGSQAVTITLNPEFSYATRKPALFGRRHGVLATDGIETVLTLSASDVVEWRLEGERAIGSVSLDAGEEVWVVLRYDDDDVRPVEVLNSREKLDSTREFWKQWAGRISYSGQYRGPVVRCAITLKLLCFVETGAMVAAPTTSLPEELGGVRNWDYRYAWLRDTCFALYSFHVLGLTEEADNFMNFVKRVSRMRGAAHLQTMYTIEGGRDISEIELTHLEGYTHSRPVRIGNNAVGQLQMDVYGEVLETAHIWARTYEMTEGTWEVTRRLVDWIADNWCRKDHGIWEDRSELREYVFSRVMCWVALDRGIRLAVDNGLEADVPRWRSEAAKLHEEVLTKGFDKDLNTFVRYYGSTDVDAAVLVIPMVRFLHRSDPKVKSTVQRLAHDLRAGGSKMIYRYRSDDGIEGQEGAFATCTFWLAQALVMIGDYEEGKELFEHMLTHANDLGLFPEELDPQTGRFLGNFPQGLTHIALINCAHVLEKLAPEFRP